MKKLLVLALLWAPLSFGSVEVDGSQVPTYPSLAAFPPLTADGDTGIALDTHILYVFNAGTATWTAVSGGAGGGQIGDPTGGTAGSVLFVDSAGDLGEDNANFFWDDTNNRLGIKNAAPGAPLDVGQTTTLTEQEVIRFSYTPDPPYYNYITNMADSATGGNEISFWIKDGAAASYVKSLSINDDAVIVQTKLVLPGDLGVGTAAADTPSGALEIADPDLTDANHLVMSYQPDRLNYFNSVTNSFSSGFDDANDIKFWVQTLTPTVQVQPLTLRGDNRVVVNNDLQVVGAALLETLITSGETYTLPTAYGTTGQFLSSTSGGVMSWATALTPNAHLTSDQATAPVATVDANAGTGATCTVSGATDVAGTINLTTTAVASATGAQCSVAFDAAYAVAPKCTFSPRNAGAATAPTLVMPYTTTSTTALVVNFVVAELVGVAYEWDYTCIEAN